MKIISQEARPNTTVTILPHCVHCLYRGIKHTHLALQIRAQLIIGEHFHPILAELIRRQGAALLQACQK